jgi:hypothetical protein
LQRVSAIATALFEYSPVGNINKKETELKRAPEAKPIARRKVAGELAS